MKYTNIELAKLLGLNLSERRLATTRPLMDAVKAVTIHQTDNTTPGADAEAHHGLQRNGYKAAAWHYTVDEDVAIQSFRDDRQLPHSGDSAGNSTSIAIELCVDADKPGEAVMGKANYLLTLDAGAKLTAILLVNHGLTLENIKQHNYWSGKNCPSFIRRGLYEYTWDDFIKAVSAYKCKLDAFINPPVEPVKDLAPEGKLFRVAIGAFRDRANAKDLMGRAKEFNPYLTIVDDPNYKGDK